MSDMDGMTNRVLELELAVARERIRGLEELVAEMRAVLEFQRSGAVVSGRGFSVIAGAALATADADAPVDAEPTQPPVTPTITWFKAAASPTAGAPAPQPKTEA